ncbi:hypothetical protein [Mucilaginibacter sp. CSA2-8R]|uniref:hypothetical protein n=1 Tax=Mucilaginibacter sp. CSA2-8R TaxID=3141542 RepID=UPI00315D5511
MKRLCLLLFVTLTCTIKSSAQPTTQQQQQAQIAALVQKIGDATVKSDFETVLAYTHPKLVAEAGGKDSLLSIVNKSFEVMKSQGIAIKSFTIGRPGEVSKIDQLYFSVVPQTLVMQVPGGTLSAQSCTLAVSEDAGQHWFFINPKAENEARLWAIFPQMKGKLIIPTFGQPIFTPDAKK